MLASDYSSSDDASLSTAPELSTEISSSNKSKQDTKQEKEQDSSLKRAIKENEDSIIQILLSPPRSPVPSNAVTSSSSENNSSRSDKTTLSSNVSDGLSPLLDYLFEDGQLTRIEYDIVDKGYGANSAAEQVQVLLRLLMESKDDHALEVLLECLKRLDPTSAPIQRLCSIFITSEKEMTEKVVFHKELQLNKSSSRKPHDFYYGTRQTKQLYWDFNGKVLCSNSDGETKDISWFSNRKTSRQQQMNKARVVPSPVDSRDFFLTNGCLEMVRNFILDYYEESISARDWEKVLGNMNGLLSTDVLSIKDLLLQIRTTDHQRLQEEETKVARLLRAIHRERRMLHQPKVREKQKRVGANSDESENESGESNEALRRYGNQEDDIKGSVRTGSENKQGSDVNWNKVIYHSLQVWKQRCGTNATFYSLIGIFQQSSLYHIADLLLDYKREIQSKENERDTTTGGNAIDVNSGTVTNPPASTMLEKSEFLRKFYTPSRWNGNDNGNLKNVGLVSTIDRVSASPVLSLELL